MARLIAPGNSRSRKAGASVDVDAGRVDSLLRYGFTEPDGATPTAKKAPAKKPAAKKSSKK